jgi:hypothetical protein
MPKVSANLVCKVTSHLKSKTHNITLSDVPLQQEAVERHYLPHPSHHCHHHRQRLRYRYLLDTMNLMILHSSASCFLAVWYSLVSTSFLEHPLVKNQIFFLWWSIRNLLHFDVGLDVGGSIAGMLFPFPSQLTIQSSFCGTITFLFPFPFYLQLCFVVETSSLVPLTLFAVSPSWVLEQGK